ncbi:uncharacterized protein LOC129767751 [Toxorhynchites rutilus septentrionalis]|uniref:uncharacterized protein LOC129767751 n=1 Tax=Toxorhynchites rutilus septentrionalis TaxID=329112 RepID=UPI00247AD0D8|nr:uncharacterized protein LOC129767751 [Toxorhynchites rutilus septentrionalis]
MRLIVGLLLVAGVSITSAVLFPYEVQESHFAYQLKSFRQSLDECAEYLEIPPEVVDRLLAFNFLTHDRDLKCLIRCAGINSGWWNELTGVQSPVIESYFQPACGDVSYRRRTQECIDSKLVACQDDCSRAYESFLCYFHQYGNLKCSEEYIPLSQLEAVQAAVDCIKILQIPRELLEQYSSGIIPDVPATHCMYRCQYLAEGLYDSQYGLNLTRFYIRHHDLPSLDYLTENAKACTEIALRESCDECARVFGAMKCLPSCHEPSYTANVFRQAAGILLGCNENGIILPLNDIPNIVRPLEPIIEPIPYVPSRPPFPSPPIVLPQPVPAPPQIALAPKPLPPPQAIVHTQSYIPLPPNPPPIRHIASPQPHRFPSPVVVRRPVIAPQPDFQPQIDEPQLPVGPPVPIERLPLPGGPPVPIERPIERLPLPVGPPVPIERPIERLPLPGSPPHPFFSKQQYFTPYSPPRPVCRHCNGLLPAAGCKHCNS